ncbi:metallophosphoesterase [Clostridium polyendosporum]|nr:metallophosphoesterase [Clostridium polyendosporum]
MGKKNILNKIMSKSPIININDNSKIVFISDCHRGDGSFKDNFLPNANIYITALNYYYNNGFTYIEIGDSDELWEIKHLKDIYETYIDVFNILLKFKENNRFYMIWGNHDEVKKKARFREKICKRELKMEGETCLYKLYNDLTIYEGLVLEYTSSNSSGITKKQSFFVVHGHQLDCINYNLSIIAKYLVRYVWSFLEVNFGFKNNTSPAKSHTKRDVIDRKIQKWAGENNQPIITGHTHNTRFPNPSENPYFNDGCCVQPYSISTIEIESGKISLVKWSVKTMNDGVLIIKRVCIGGPEFITKY